MSLATNVTDLATRIASEIKTIRTQVNGNAADLSGLTTTSKASLVAAINEIAAAVGDAGAKISDATVSTLTVWSSSKTDAEIKAAVAALVAASPGALDTLNEIAAALGDDPNFATSMATSLGNRVRFDAAQTLTAGEKSVARGNIGAGTSNLVIGTGAGTAADAAALATALGTKANTASPTFTGTVSGITKAMVGLSNVDNTADSAKPVSTATATALGGKSDTGHKHLVADITDTTTVGDAVMKAASAAAARTAIGAGTSNLVIGTTSGTAADAALTNTALAGKAATSHTHTTAQVTGLDTALAGKSDTSHTHPSASETVLGLVELATTAEASTGTDATRAVTPAGLKAVADTKALASHTHTTAQVTGLDTALAGKSATSHTHTMASLTDTSVFGTSLGTTASAVTARSLLAVFSTTDIGDVNTNFVATFEAGLV